MKMQCEKAQEQILTEDIVNSELESHLNECDDCREFQKGLGVMMTDQQKFEVPKALDDKILDFAKNNRPEKKTNKPVIPFMIMAIAAIVAILLSVALLNNQSSNATGSEEIVDNQEVIKVRKSLITNNEVKETPDNALEKEESFGEILKKQEVVNSGNALSPFEQDKPKEMVAESLEESPSIDNVLNNLWGDDSIDADLMAVESELFVLSAELYSN